jgi:hypothetical protein
MKSTSFPRSAVCLACATATFVLPIGLHARTNEKTTTGWFEHSRNNAWLLPYDTTLITRRALSELSYESHDNDDAFWKIETSLRGAYALGEDLAFGLQMMVPVKCSDTSLSDESGLGDLEFRTGLIGRMSPTLRWGTGLNAELDTASDTSLGSNALILRPTLALRWDATERINAGINIEYSFTPQEERVDDVSALELKFPFILKLNQHWSAAAGYKPKWNFINDSDRHRLELGGTRLWGADNQFAWSFSLEIPLASERMDYKLVSGLSWHF